MLKVTWPDGKRIAVLLAFDLDAETMWLNRGDGNRDHLQNLSRGSYGPRQGVPRILEMLDRHQVKATFFVPGYIADLYPETTKEIARRGHEIAFHGYYHEDDPTTPYEEEKERMEHCNKLFEDMVGQTLRGHRAPEGIMYDYSLKLFLEQGYIHSSNWRHSDGPYIHEVDGKRVPLVELPKDSIFDDTAYDFFTDSAPERYELKSAREMREIWQDEFDALAQEGRMMNFVMHPQHMGRASRIAMLSDFIGYMKANGAWFATNVECAEYVLKQEGML